MKRILTLLAFVALTITANAAVIQSGSCGDNVTFVLNDDGTLVISGSGEMTNYNSSSSYPWYNNRSKIIKAQIEDGVTSIGRSAFYNCSGLTSVTIPNSVTIIGDGAFYNCSGLTSVAVNCTDETDFAKYLSRTDIYSVFHSSSSGLSGKSRKLLIDGVEPKNVVIPNSVTSIGNYALYGCSNFLSVIIGSSVTKIGSNAFTNPNIVKTIWLPNTPPSGYENAVGKINYVANDQFTGISSDKKKVYPYLSSMFETGGIKYVPVSPSERTCDAIDCVYGEQSKNIVIAENVSYKGIAMKVQNVNPYTCYGNEHIQSVELSHKGEIGLQAFYNCAGINKLTIQVKGNIGPSAFYNCSGIKTLYLKANGYIGESAFEKCTSIESAAIAEGVTSMKSRAFYNCSSLKEIVIPNSVTDVNSGAFYNCKSIEKAVIGSGVTNIGISAFEDCSSLTNVTFNASKNNMSIGSFSFGYCSSLPQIEIPENVKSIGDYAFGGCSKLANVTIADRSSNLSLGSNGSSPLFNDCPLETVYIGGPISYSKSSSYGYSPFYRNTSLKSVTITDTEIEVYDNEFYGCTALKDVKIGDGVTKIGNWAFSGCSSLESFSFGSKTKSIGKEAFSDCTALTQITTSAITPPTCGDQALDDINKWTCTLSVPSQSISLYQAADQWKEFFFIEENPNAYHAVTLNKDDLVDVYNANGVKIRSNVNKSKIASELPAGMYIINGKKVIVK